MNDFEPSDIHEYKVNPSSHRLHPLSNDIQTFEDFFVRKHKPGSRPIFAENDNVKPSHTFPAPMSSTNPFIQTRAVVVADSRLVVYDTVSQTKRLWIKGKNFTIANLLQDTQLAESFTDGAVASFRLSPQDYHRYHTPVGGTVVGYKRIRGDYYNVDPVAINSSVDILTRNARCWICIESKEFGKVMFVAIGATDVGTVE